MMNEILVWVLSICGGVTVSGLVSAIIYACLKGAFNKAIARINVEKIADKATEKGVERVKKIAFTHDIQPLCESELEKINEKADKHIEKTVARLESKLDKVILIQEKQAAYFDNSIGVTDTAKAELKKAIEDAKTKIVEPVESVVVEEEPKNVELIVTKPSKSKVSR